jgi:hypothetical protein
LSIANLINASNLLGISWVAYVNDDEIRMSSSVIRQVGVVAQDCNAIGISASAAAAYPAWMGGVSHVDHDQAPRLGRDKRVSVLHGHGVGWSTRKQWPPTTQIGVEVKRDSAEANATKR